MVAFSGHQDLAYSTVLTPPSPATSGTSLTLAAGGGALMPTVLPFYATVAPPNVRPTHQNAEVVKVTAVAGDVLTIERAVGGTIAQAIDVDWAFFASVTSEWAYEVEQAINAIVPGDGIGLIASNTTFTNGLVSLVESGGGITIGTGPGQQVILSVPAQTPQTVQTQDVIDMTVSGNTAGVLALMSSGTVTLVGGNNITLSQQGNSVVISGANAGGAQTGISSVAVSDTTYTSGQIQITGVGGGVTVQSNTGQRVDISVAAPVAQSVQTQGIIALSASDHLYTSGTVVLSGDGVTVSTDGQTVIVSADAQSIDGPSAFVFDGATYTSGTVVISGGANVSIGTAAGQVVTISASNQSVQTQNAVDVTLSGNTAGALALVSSGTLTLAGGNRITLSQAGNAVTVSGPDAQTGISGIANSQTTFVSGTVSLSELGAITIRSTTGNQFQFSVNAQSVQPETQTFVGGIGNSQTTYTSGTVNLSVVAGNMTIRSTTGQAFQFSLSQTNQAGTVFAVSNTFGTSSGTYDARTLSIAGAGIVSVAASNSGWRISASQSAQTQNVVVPAASNTTYTSGTYTITGVGGGVTVSSNTGQRIDISVAAQSVQTQNVVDVSLSGNTAGAMALISSGTMTLAGGNNITLSQAGNAVTISAPNAIAETQTAISGIANSETTYTSGSVTLSAFANITIRSTTGQQFQFSVPSGATATGNINAISNSNTTYTSGTIGLSELGAITIRSTTGNQFQFSVNSQSVQPETQTFVGGLGNSQTTYTSGTVSLSVEGGALTIRSTTGQAFRFSVSQSVQAETQTFIGGIGNSETTYTSGTVNLSVVGGAATIRSTTGNAFQLSVSQSVQPETQTFVGGIGNSQTTYTSGTVNLSVVAGNLTIRSTTGNAFQFSMSQTVQAETQTAISGLANSQTTYTSGTVSLSELGAITIRSTTGNQFQFSVNSQTVQTQNVVDVTLSGNTAGAMALISSGTMTLAGGNNITLSQAGNAVTISAGGGGETQTAISGIANSQTTYTSGTVSLSELGAITIRSTTGNQFQFSVAAQTAQTGISGVANSQTTYTSGTVSLSELGAITIRSTTGNQYQFSVAAQTVQTQNVVDVSLSGNTAGAMALISSGTMTLVGGNNITLSQAGNAVTVVGPSGGAETQTAISGLANSETTYTSGSVTLSALANITIRSTTGQHFQFSVPSGATATGNINAISNSNTTYTSGTIGLSELGAITIRSTTGNQFQFSVNSQSVQPETKTFLGGLAGSNTTYTSGTVTITGVGGGVTVSSNTGQRIDISVAAPVAQTNQSGNIYAASNTFGTSSGTYDARTLSIVGDGIISIAASNSGWRISATQSVQTQSIIRALYDGANSITSGTVRLTNANGFTFTQNGQTLSGSVNESISMFAVSNTTQSSSGTAHKSALSFGGAGGVSVGVTGGSVVISAAAGGAGLSAGMSTNGNTSGNTGLVTGRLAIMGGNNITLSGSTNAGSMSITISAPNLGAGAMSVGISTGGNTFGDTGVTGTRMVFVGTNAISLTGATGAAGGTISIDAPATSSLSATGQVSISTNGSTISIGVPDDAVLSYWNPQDAYLQVTGQQGQGTLHIQPAQAPNVTFDRIVVPLVFSLTTSTARVSLTFRFGVYTRNASTLNLLTSQSTAWQMTVSTGNTSLFQGLRLATLPFTSSLSEGQYWVGVVSSSSSSSANMSISQIVASQQNSTFSGMFSAATASSVQYTRGLGRYSAATDGLPSAIAFSEIYGQSSMILRQPMFYLVSGTV